MRDAVTSGTGTAARIDRDVAGKTGTTDNRTDAWFLGLTPGLVAAVWRGAPNALVSGAGFGGQYPAQVWRSFMSAELADEPELEFDDPGPACNRPGTYIRSGDEPVFREASPEFPTPPTDVNTDGGPAGEPGQGANPPGEGTLPPPVTPPPATGDPPGGDR
jgi:penicillin-binding protein 1A